MKLNPNPTERNRDRAMNGAAKPTQRTGEPAGPTRTRVPERFRRLKRNELVCQGDFVADGHKGLEPWEGPGGFPSRRVCETDLPEEGNRKVPADRNRKIKAKLR